MNVAMLLSCGSFEGFFCAVQGQSRESYLSTYRNDWVWYYALGLLENGIKPTIFIPSLYEEGRYETETGISVRFIKLNRWYHIIERIKPLKQISRQTKISLYIEERLNTIAFMKGFKKAIADDKIDLVYIQEYWSGRFDHIVHRVSLPVSAVNQGGISTASLNWFKRRAMKKAVVCYGQTKDECRQVELFDGKAEFQPNGCDVKIFNPDHSIKITKTVLTVARLTDKQKRTSDLIKAMALLPEEWTLDIVGTGPDKAMLQDLASKLGVSSRVRFHGFVGREAVRDFLCRCGVYVMPSDNEAVAMAALEAMGCGAAVILSRISTFEQLIEDGKNGYLVTVGDVKGIADRIEKAWQNREALGCAAYATIQSNYNSESLYNKLANSMRESVKRYRSASL